MQAFKIIINLLIISCFFKFDLSSYTWTYPVPHPSDNAIPATELRMPEWTNPRNQNTTSLAVGLD